MEKASPYYFEKPDWYIELNQSNEPISFEDEQRVTTLFRSAKLQAYLENRNKVVSVFSELVQNEQFLAQCCRGSQSCIRNVSATHLDVDILGDSASYSEGRVRVSAGIILKFHSLERLESVIAHELGHACVDSLLKERDPRYEFSKTTDAQHIPLYRSLVKSVLGPEYLACLSSHAPMTNYNRTRLHAGYYSEALAQALSVGYFKRRTDLMDGAVGFHGYKWGVRCLFSDPMQQQRICQEQ